MVFKSDFLFLIKVSLQILLSLAVTGCSLSTSLKQLFSEDAISLQLSKKLISGGSNAQITYAVPSRYQVDRLSAELYIENALISSDDLPTGQQGSYTFSVPPNLTTPNAYLLLKLKSGANTFNTRVNFEIDSEPPTLQTNGFAKSIYKTNDIIQMTWKASDTNLNAASTTLSYNLNNSSNWIEIAKSLSKDSFAWTLPPLEDTESLRIRVGVYDLAMNLSMQEFDVIEIDNTPPVLSFSALSKSYFKNTDQELLKWTSFDKNLTEMHSKVDISKNNGLSWQEIFPFQDSSSASFEVDNTFSCSNCVLRVTTQDIAGNTAQALSESFVIDNLSPSITLSNDLTDKYFKGNTTLQLFYTILDSHLETDSLYLDYTLDGSNWISVQKILSSGPLNWTIPSVDSSSVQLRIRASDLSGNTNSFITDTFSIITTLPSLTLESHQSHEVLKGGASTNVQFKFQFNEIGSISFDLQFKKSPTEDWSTVQTSVDSPYSWQLPLINCSQCQIRMKATNSLGDESFSNSSAAFTIDSAPPIVSWTANAQTYLSNLSDYQITWIASDSNFGTNPISIDYSTDSITWISLSGNVANNGKYLWRPNFGDGAKVHLRVRATDMAGNTSTSQAQNSLIVDSALPIMQTFSINDGMLQSTKNSVKLSFSASDNSLVQRFCLKNSNTAPTSTDSCWINLSSYGINPDKTIEVNNIFYNFGYVSGLLDIYIWVMDGAGNISSLQNNGLGENAVDTARIELILPKPPVFSNIQAANFDFSSSLSPAETKVPKDTPLFIKWKISDSNIPAGKINIFYTTNDSDYQPLESGLNNSANSACNLNPDFTGCALLMSPTDEYFRVRIIAEDEHSLKTIAVTNPLNSGSFDIIAGSTELGLGASARSAILNPTNSLATFAVLDDGRIFVSDQRGIAWVNPTTGVYEILIKNTGTLTGDGGPAINATTAAPSMIYADYQNNILFIDSGRIRKIWTNSMIVDTFIGGGTNKGDFIENPKEYGHPAWHLYLIPNGDIAIQNAYYTSGFHYYSAADKTINRRAFIAGIGNSFSESQINDDCLRLDRMFLTYNHSFQVDHIVRYVSSTKNSGRGNGCDYGNTTEWGALISVNPQTMHDQLPAPKAIKNTAASQGLYSGYREPTLFNLAKNGKLYAFHGYQSGDPRIYSFNKTTLSWDYVAGTERPGTCPEGTPATSCPTIFQSVTTNSQGQIFYYDAKAKVIRTIDSQQNVRTVVGDKLGSDDGTSPTAVRFKQITDVKSWYDPVKNKTQLYIYDFGNDRIRGIYSGESIKTIAGIEACGSPNTTKEAKLQGLPTCGDGASDYLIVDKSNGSIFYGWVHNVIGRLDHGTNLWVPLLYPTIGYARISGFDNSDSLYIARNTTKSENNVLRHRGLVGLATLPFNGPSAFADKIYPEENIPGGDIFCEDGTPLTNCQVRGVNAYAQFDELTASWLVAESGTRVVKIPRNMVGNMETFTILPFPAKNIVLNRPLDGSKNEIIYCDHSGKIRKYDMKNIPHKDHLYSYPTDTYKCTGALDYSKERNSVIFVFEQNGLHGVGEFKLD